MAMTARRLLIVLALTVCHPAPGWAQAPVIPGRVALVLGNATYPQSPLATPGNDAGLVAKMLVDTGWTVTGGRELGYDALASALDGFVAAAKAAGPKGAAFLFLSGHVVQRAGENYYLPVDGSPGIRISDFTRRLDALPLRARFYVLDGAHSPAPTGDAVGMAEVEPAKGSLWAYNATPGTAVPSEQGPLGTYATVLADALAAGSPDGAGLFANVRARIVRENGGTLVPWERSRLVGRFAFRRPDASAQPLEGDDAPSLQRLEPPAGFQADLGAYPTPPATYVTQIYRPYYTGEGYVAADGNGGYAGPPYGTGQADPPYGQGPHHHGHHPRPGDGGHPGRPKPPRPGNEAGQPPGPSVPGPPNAPLPSVGGASIPQALPRRDYPNQPAALPPVPGPGQAVVVRPGPPSSPVAPGNTANPAREQQRDWRSVGTAYQSGAEQRAIHEAQMQAQQRIREQQQLDRQHAIQQAYQAQQNMRYQAAPVPHYEQPHYEQPAYAPDRSPSRPSLLESRPSVVTSAPGVQSQSTFSSSPSLLQGRPSPAAQPSAVTQAGPVAQPSPPSGGGDQPCGRYGGPPCRAR